MNTALWIIAGLLALVFAGAGAQKLATSKKDLLEKMPWAADFSESQIKGIGLAELAGGIGLVLPPLTDIAPVLAPIAAVGLAITMAGAAAVHIRRGDKMADVVPSVLFGALALFVAIMRFGPESF